jgi:hypothetical protein
VIEHPAVEGIWGVVGREDAGYAQCTSCDFGTYVFAEMSAHMKETRHGYTVIHKAIEGWLVEPVAARTETIPGYWE